jgi:hypothetical protein
MIMSPAWRKIIRNENTLLAVVKSALCSGLELSNSMISEPARSWMMRPAVTMGPIPSSRRVPRVEAKMIRMDWSPP